MKIAATEAKTFVTAVFDLNDKGIISDSDERELHKWGDSLGKAIEAAGGLTETDSIELPPHLISLYRKYQQSNAYAPDADSLLMQAEDKTRYFHGKAPAHTRFNVKPETNTSMQTSSSFLQEFDPLTGPTKRTLDTLEQLRRGDTDAVVGSAVRRHFAALRQERRSAFGDPVAKLLDASEERREIWEALGRKFTGGTVTTAQGDLIRSKAIVQKAFTPGISPSDDFGGGMFLAAAVSEDLLYASYVYGAYGDLGVRVLSGARMKFAKVTQPTQGVFITPTQQGKVTLTPDPLVAGDQVCELANTILALVEISLELVADGKTVISEAVLRALSQGHAKAVDYACFQGNGADDPLNGTQTGIFMDANIPSAAAANGGTNVGALTRDDFIGAVAAVDPSALTREPRWFISPALLPKLLKLRDGQGPKYLLKTPAQTEGEWELVGFPVTWSIQAPANDAAGQKVAAFGAPDGYLVALQENMEVLASDDARFNAAIRQMRLANRGRVETRESTWFATLKLAAQ